MSETVTLPTLSVVVVILGGRPYIPRCLTALAQQVGVADIEIVVPCDERITDITSLQDQFPGVRFVAVAGRRTYAELRALGFQTARGAIIALTEDHCLPAPNWCQEILAAHAGPHAAVGGAVDKAGSDTALNWAIYLCDFGRYMPPLRQGPAASLTDCNVAYKRAALASLGDLWQTEFHETTVHWALQAQGASLWLSPRIVVRQQRSLGWGAALRERFAFGRLFASTRVAATSLPRRVLYTLGSVALPALLLGRVARQVWSKRRHRREFVRALPALLVLTVVWAVGEGVGYVTGRAGTEPAQDTPSSARIGQGARV